MEHEVNVSKLNVLTNSQNRTKKMVALLEIARPLHGIKNLLVLLPWLLSGAGIENIFPPIVAAISFWCASIAVYSINDALDSFYDMMDPKKCDRPVPSGRISENEAFLFSAFAFGASLVLAASISIEAMFLIIAYSVLNIFYSKIGKDLAIIDVTLVSFGFLLRFYVGIVVTGALDEIQLLIGPIFFGALGLALGKRLVKLASQRGAIKRVPSFYDKKRLVWMMLFVSHLAVGALVAFFASGSGSIEELLGLSKVVITLLSIGIIIVLSQSLSLMIAANIEPTETLLHDRINLTLVGIFAMMLLIDLKIF